MDSILNKYNTLLEMYQQLENDFSKLDIQDRNNILLQIIPLLSACKIKFSKVKNGKKAIELYEKLRNIEVQLTILENSELNAELIIYQSMLRDKALKVKWKIQRFNKRKVVEFPQINKKSTADKTKVIDKVTKMLEKLDRKVHSGFIDYPANIHKLSKLFSKFLFQVEILSCLENLSVSKLENLKKYQDQLRKIEDYEVLMNGIARYFMKREWYDDQNVAIFEQEQNTLYETFIFSIEAFITDCRLAVQLNMERTSEVKEIAKSLV